MNDNEVNVKDSWKSVLDVPSDKLRNYFGDKIALYFCFLSFYSKALIFPSVLGILPTIILFIFDNNSIFYRISNAVYLFAFLAWSVYFFERWQQKE